VIGRSEARAVRRDGPSAGPSARRRAPGGGHCGLCGYSGRWWNGSIGRLTSALRSGQVPAVARKVRGW